jgi:hypothetical protein
MRYLVAYSATESTDSAGRAPCGKAHLRVGRDLEIRSLAYLAVALDDAEDGAWNDPEFLESVRRFGEMLTLSEGGSLAVSLKLAIR